MGTTNLNRPLFVLSNSGFQSFQALKIQTWRQKIRCRTTQAARGVNLMPRAFITPKKVESRGSPVAERAL